MKSEKLIQNKIEYKINEKRMTIRMRMGVNMEIMGSG